MAKISKRMRALYEKVDTSKLYTADEAVNLVKDIATAKFVESVDVSINLGIDPKKSDQNIRGAIVLPHGSGRQVRVCVFTQGENAEAAKAAGAEFVGMQELAAQIKGGMMDFDVVIASPDAMRVVGQLGQILGPRGLMPNPKVGTVTRDVAQAVKNAKAGQVAYRNDKSAIVHTTIGLANFSAADLKDNLAALISAIRKAKPATSKGVFLKKINLSTTMGVGVNVDPASIADNAGRLAVPFGWGFGPSQRPQAGNLNVTCVDGSELQQEVFFFWMMDTGIPPLRGRVVSRRKPDFPGV